MVIQWGQNRTKALVLPDDDDSDDDTDFGDHINNDGVYVCLRQNHIFFRKYDIGGFPYGLMIPGPGEDNDDNDDSGRTKALALAQCHLRHRDRLSSQTARQFYFYICRFLQHKSQQIKTSFTALFHPFKSCV